MDTDITTSRGRKIVRDLAENKKYVGMRNNAVTEVRHKWEDVFEEGINRLSDFYDTDMRTLVYEELKKLEKDDLQNRTLG